MKPIYENNGYKVYRCKILGYPCSAHCLPSGNVSVSVPLGKEGSKDRKMFDTLVYYNQMVYHGSTKKEVIAKVRSWILKYKRGVK